MSAVSSVARTRSKREAEGPHSTRPPVEVLVRAEDAHAAAAAEHVPGRAQLAVGPVPDVDAVGGNARRLEERRELERDLGPGGDAAAAEAVDLDADDVGGLEEPAHGGDGGRLARRARDRRAQGLLEQGRVDRTARGDEARATADGDDRPRGGRLRPGRRPRQEGLGRAGERRRGDRSRGEPGQGPAAAGVRAHGCSSNTWPVKTEKRRPVLPAVGGQPGLLGESGERLLDRPALLRRHLGQEERRLVALLQDDAVRAELDVAPRGDGLARREDRDLDLDPAELGRGSPARSGGRAAPRRARPARCRSRAGRSARAGRCSRAGGPSRGPRRGRCG